jgi:hypothetical protein
MPNCAGPADLVGVVKFFLVSNTNTHAARTRTGTHEGPPDIAMWLDWADSPSVAAGKKCGAIALTRTLGRRH